MDATDRREPDPARSEPPASERKTWSPPRIADHGSIRHLVRGISGPFPDTTVGKMLQVK
jgi:hypothetical protein